MPIYKFVCIECNKEQEQIHSIEDRTNAVCKFCGGKVKQLLTAFGFRIPSNEVHFRDRMNIDTGEREILEAKNMDKLRR